MDSAPSRRSTGGGCHRQSSAADVAGKHLIRTETCANGGASYVVLDDKAVRALGGDADPDRLVDEFFRQAFSVDGATGMPRHVMAIVRGGAGPLPDPLRYLAENAPQVQGQCRKMHRTNLVESVSMGDYYRTVQGSFAGNCTRADPLNSISLVGTVSEEIGGHFPEMLSSLEESSPFLNATMPWGRLSKLKLRQPTESNDGPILWVRPGEQMIPSHSDLLADQPAKRIRKSNPTSLADLYSQKRGGSRETLFEDRTYCHADQVTDGARQTTCAVGLLKAVTQDGKPAPENLVVKQVTAFSAESFNQVVSEMQIDLWEPPVSQCKTWVCRGKLNALHWRLGNELRYARIELHADDIYFIPRHVVHQFQTVAACTSIAWHLRYAGYAGLPQFDVPSLLPSADEAAQPAATPPRAGDEPRKPAPGVKSPSAVRRKRKRTHRVRSSASSDHGDSSVEAESSPTTHDKQLAATLDSKRIIATDDAKPTTTHAAKPSIVHDAKPSTTHDAKPSSTTTTHESKSTTSNDGKRRIAAPALVLSVGKRSSSAAATSFGEATANMSVGGRSSKSAPRPSSPTVTMPTATSSSQATVAATSSASGRSSKAAARSSAAAAATSSRENIAPANSSASGRSVKSASRSSAAAATSCETTAPANSSASGRSVKSALRSSPPTSTTPPATSSSQPAVPAISSASGRSSKSAARSSTGAVAAAASFGEATAAAAATSFSSHRRSAKRSLAASPAPSAILAAASRELSKAAEQRAANAKAAQRAPSTVKEQVLNLKTSPSPSQFDLVPSSASPKFDLVPSSASPKFDPVPSSSSPKFDPVPSSSPSGSTSGHTAASPQPARVDAEVKQENSHVHPGGVDGDSDSGCPTAEQQLVASCKPLFVPPPYLTAQQQCQSSSRQQASSRQQSRASLHA